MQTSYKMIGHWSLPEQYCHSLSENTKKQAYVVVEKGHNWTYISYSQIERASEPVSEREREMESE